MSHLNVMKTQMTDKEALIRALCKKLCIQRQDIEVHDTPVRLHGYHEEDNFYAHIVVRKGKSGIPSDIGWEFKNGVFIGHIDKYDYRGVDWNISPTVKIRPTVILDETWCQNLQDIYNLEMVKIGLESRGIKFSESTTKDGYPVLTYYVDEEENGKMSF